MAQLAADQSVQRLLHSSSLPVFTLWGIRASGPACRSARSEGPAVRTPSGCSARRRRGARCRVMAALDLQLRIGPADIIHGMLLLIDAGRGLEHRAEHDGHSVGDAAVDAAVLVRGGGDFASRIVNGSLASLPCIAAKPKPAPNSMPLQAGMANIRWASSLSTLSNHARRCPRADRSQSFPECRRRCRPRCPQRG